MWGRATLTIVVSRTCISVADITAKVMNSRDAPSAGTAAAAVLFTVVCVAGDEDAAMDEVQQRVSWRIAPPARKAPSLPVADHNEISAESLCRGRYVFHR